MTHNPSATADNPYEYVGQLGYYTHYQESSLALLQLGVRYYDQSLGRFTQRDAIVRERESAYAYVSDGPILATDPSGLLPPTWIGPRIPTYGGRINWQGVTWDSSHCTHAMDHCMSGSLTRQVAIWASYAGLAAGTAITWTAQVGKFGKGAIKWVSTAAGAVVDVSAIFTIITASRAECEAREFCCKHLYTCGNILCEALQRRRSIEWPDVRIELNIYLKRYGCRMRVSGNYSLGP